VLLCNRVCPGADLEEKMISSIMKQYKDLEYEINIFDVPTQTHGNTYINHLCTSNNIIYAGNTDGHIYLYDVRMSNSLIKCINTNTHSKVVKCAFINEYIYPYTILRCLPILYNNVVIYSTLFL
jgi:hypothetical protein